MSHLNYHLLYEACLGALVRKSAVICTAFLKPVDLSSHISVSSVISFPSTFETRVGISSGLLF